MISDPAGLRIPRSVATKHEKAIRSVLGLSTGRLWEERPDREEEEEVMMDSLSSPLSSLTGEDISALMTAEEELSQTRQWSRIFPPQAGSGESDYLQYWSSTSPSRLDWLLQAWEEKYGASQASRQQGREALRDLAQTQSVSI